LPLLSQHLGVVLQARPGHAEHVAHFGGGYFQILQAR